MATASGNILTYSRGSLLNQIEFDPGRAFSIAGGKGDIFRGTLHRSSHPDGSPFEYSYVALKRMRWGTNDEDKRLDNVLDEAYVWKRLHHINLLRLLGLLSDGGDMYLVAPFATHGSLPQYITAHPDVDRPNLLGQIAAGIAYLHEKNMVHGDLKGPNVLVFDGPTAKICDFGLSKVVDGNQTTNSQYSLPWTSPERLLGGSRSYPSDVYAFGITIFEILSGEIPFRSLDSFLKFVEAICTNALRPPKYPASSAEGISYALLWALAERCWHVDAAERPSMKEVCDLIAPPGAVAGGEEEDLPMLSMPSRSSNAVVRTRKRIDSADEHSGFFDLNSQSVPSEIEATQDPDPHRSAKKRKMRQHNEVWTSSDDENGGLDLKNSRLVEAQAKAVASQALLRVDFMPRAKSASHHASRPNAPTVCLEGTRTAVLHKIYDWAKSMDPDTPRVFWLNGMAGTGKSTITQTLAEHAEQEGVLGASFFFSRHGDGEVRNASLVIPTIAFQMTRTVPLFKFHLAEQLEKDPDVAHAVRQRQLKMLLATPLQATERSEPLLVVLDALDECEGRDAAELLQLLLAMMSQPGFTPAFKLFIACRPDRELNPVFQRAQAHQKFILHDVEQDVVQADIELYLRDGLTNPPPDFLPTDWISAADLKELVRRSGKLFVYATTTLKFLRGGGLDSPEKQLETLLLTSNGVGENTMDDLDDLYLQVLQSAITPRDSRPSDSTIRRAADRLRGLLGTIVLLRTSLPIRHVAELTRISSHQILSTLQLLQSVVVFPNTIDESAQFLHQSFPDFIASPDRCRDRRFVLDIPEQERQLAGHCLRLMTTSLRRNTALSQTEKETETATVIGLELEYACCHWASHLFQSPGEPELIELLGDFANRCLLWWLEALSVAGQVARAARLVDDALTWALLSRAPDGTTTILHDAHRFVLAHLQCISKGAEHVYLSALPFTPRSTSFWKKYQHEAFLSLRVLSGVEADWLPSLGTLTGHEGGVNTIAFSPDGTRIATGSEDQTVRVWDAFSGQPTSTMPGHTYGVETIVFSTDCSRIVSVSYDKTVRVWNAISGQPVVTHGSDSKPMKVVAISADTARIASVENFCDTVHVVDTVSCQRVVALEGHSGHVNAVAFSPDGTRIASGSDDESVRIWDAVSGHLVMTLRGHSHAVEIVLFSSNGSRVVSASYDATIRIWDAASGRTVAVIQGDFKPMKVIALSVDGTRIASTQDFNETARLWNANSGQLVATLKGHSGHVNDIVFSPNGTRVASVSHDKTVHIWDAISGRPIFTLEGHSSWVVSVAYSPDGARVASGSRDNTVRIWDSQPIITQGGHSSRARAVAPSPDDTRIVAVYDDKIARVWDAVSGHLITTLEGRIGIRDIIMFSADGTRIASLPDELLHVFSGRPVPLMEDDPRGVETFMYSHDDTPIMSGPKGEKVRIWDALSGQAIAPVEDYSQTIVISPDGTRIAYAPHYKTGGIRHSIPGRRTALLEGPSAGKNPIIFSPHGTQFISGYASNAVRICDTVSGRTISTLNGHSKPASTIAFSPHGNRVVSGSMDSTVRLWDAISGHAIASLKVDEKDEGVEVVAFYEDAIRIGIQHRNGRREVWDPTFDEANMGGSSLLETEAWPYPRNITRSISNDPADHAHDEVLLSAMLDKWSYSVNIPSFTMCGSKVHAITLFPDGRTMAVMGSNSQEYLLHRPRVHLPHVS